MNNLKCEIHALTPLNHDTTKVLLAVRGERRLDFKAGQYLELVLPTGKHCPFSIASGPGSSDTIELHIRPTPGSEDSQRIQQLLEQGAEVDIVAPKGNCFIDRAPERPILMLAASTGFTQMKSMLEFLFSRGFDHPIYLYWGVVSAGDLYFDDECAHWANEHDTFEYRPVVSEPSQSPGWAGRAGLVADAVASDFDSLENFAVYIGGGPAMVQASVDTLRPRSLQLENLHSDMLEFISL